MGQDSLTEYKTTLYSIVRQFEVKEYMLLELYSDKRGMIMIGQSIKRRFLFFLSRFFAADTAQRFLYHLSPPGPRYYPSSLWC